MLNSESLTLISTVVKYYVLIRKVKVLNYPVNKSINKEPTVEHIVWSQTSWASLPWADSPASLRLSFLISKTEVMIVSNHIGCCEINVKQSLACCSK